MTQSISERTFKVGPQNVPKPRELPPRWAEWLGHCRRCDALRWAEEFSVAADAWQIMCLECGHLRNWRKPSD